VVQEAHEGKEEEHVEEFFDQLWAVPEPVTPRVHDPHSKGGCLVWIWKELVRKKRVQPKDCFPVGRNLRFDHPPTRLSWSCDICFGGG
jgi:hypothetical protein